MCSTRVQLNVHALMGHHSRGAFALAPRNVSPIPPLTHSCVLAGTRVVGLGPQRLSSTPMPTDLMGGKLSSPLDEIHISILPAVFLPGGTGGICSGVF